MQEAGGCRIWEGSQEETLGGHGVGIPDQKVTFELPRENKVSSGIIQPRRQSPAAHPKALEAAQALVTHGAARLEGPEAWDVVAQVVQLQLLGHLGSESSRTSPAPMLPGILPLGPLGPTLIPLLPQGGLRESVSSPRNHSGCARENGGESSTVPLWIS